jgi:predicted DNA-binding protein (MmcQ/YjbR family)
VSHLARIEALASRLPGATRVDIEAWGGEPTFRVNGKNFVFAAADGTAMTVKLPVDEAGAVVATDPRVVPAAYGLGRNGWVTVSLPGRIGKGRWRELEEWIRTSYTLVAPKRLARQVLEEDVPGG